MRISKVIYVAGPFRAQSEWGLVQNIRHAEEVSLKLWSDGWVVLTPHKNTQNFQGALPDKVWLDGCLELLRRCDAIYMLKGFRQSAGAMMEYNLAQKLGKEIYYEAPLEKC